MRHHTGSCAAEAQAAPTATGTTAAGRVRGRAPTTHFFQPSDEGDDDELIGQVSHGTYAECVNELVCLDVVCGQSMVDRIKQAWDSGDAIFPLDQRLPAPERARVLQTIKPTIVYDGNEDARIHGHPVEPGDAVVVATSGTTGQPKGVVLTHDAVTASARATSDRLGVTTTDTWFACLPPAHVGGLSVVLRSLITGTTLVTAPQFSVDAYNNAARNGATLVSLVATALQRVDPHLYRHIVLGGSRPPSSLPDNCSVTYGLTETGSGVVYNRKPLEGVEIDIREGIIWLRAPMLLRCYRDDSVPLDGNGWFRTGDLGSFHDGLLAVDGREGDLIITGGENVWPERVEEVLSRHPSIADVCVGGVPHPEWGHTVTAWVVLAGDHTLELHDVRDFVKESLPAHCAPHAVHVVDQIPRTALGKPKRSELIASATT